jgi:hypothetical protein
MHTLPLLKDIPGELASPCCPRPGATKELHKYHRTLPIIKFSNPGNDLLEDETGVTILLANGDSILDNLKNNV